jgi:phenylalanyl-tRNA synthetase beta chain
MRICLEWLADFVTVPPLPDLCDALQRAGIEVEAVDDPRARSKGTVVAEVLACEPHPAADNLKVCQVHDGQSTVTVVCGAPNVRAGQRFAFAPVGASLLTDSGWLTLEPRMIRGIESAGMLCSEKELGLGEDSTGILALPEATVGQSALDAVRAQPTLTLSITPNRPDLLSHLGVAREVAAATSQRVRTPSYHLSEKGRSVTPQVRVLVDAPQRCPRYVARCIQGVEVGPSPEWLQRRLRRVGQRPVNNVVDVTNYVLFEMGQPTHAFDASRVAGEGGVPKLRVRMAGDGERIKTLDGQERSLFAQDLVIADQHRVLALAGVMGGEHSEVTATTTSVILECANFDAKATRLTSKRHGLRTESSIRFERGTDAAMVARAADRCARMLAEVCRGQVASGRIEVAQKDVATEQTIELRTARVEKVLGVSLAPELIVELLDPLEIRCASRNDMALRFQVPPFRVDLSREVDLIEEVARRHGYDQIPERLPSAAGEVRPRSAVRDVVSCARDALLSSGLSEVVTYAFGKPAIGDVRILNPLGEEYSTLRASLLPGLIEVLGHAQRQGHKSSRIFEIGRVFRSGDGALPIEETLVALLQYGGRHMGRWYECDETVDMSDLVGVFEALRDAVALQTPPSQVQQEMRGYNPRAGGAIEVGGTRIGEFGRLHPDRLRALSLRGHVFALECSLDALGAQPQRTVCHQDIGRYPRIRRDGAVITALAVDKIARFIRAHAGPDVREVKLFDRYAGKGVPAGKVSLAYAIIYQAGDRTLTDAEVGASFAALLEALPKELEVEIRS